MNQNDITGHTEIMVGYMVTDWGVQQQIPRLRIFLGKLKHSNYYKQLGKGIRKFSFERELPTVYLCSSTYVLGIYNFEYRVELKDRFLP